MKYYIFTEWIIVLNLGTYSTETANRKFDNVASSDLRGWTRYRNYQRDGQTFFPGHSIPINHVKLFSNFHGLSVKYFILKILFFNKLLSSECNLAKNIPALLKVHRYNKIWKC